MIIQTVAGGAMMCTGFVALCGGLEIAKTAERRRIKKICCVLSGGLTFVAGAAVSSATDQQISRPNSHVISIPSKLVR